MHNDAKSDFFLQSMSRILPARQWQVKPSMVLLQLALFLHGDALHPAFTGVSQAKPVKATNRKYTDTVLMALFHVMQCKIFHNVPRLKN